MSLCKMSLRIIQVAVCGNSLFQCVDIPHFIYPFSDQKTLGLFVFFCDFKKISINFSVYMFVFF